MREIKFRITWQREKDKNIFTQIFDWSQIKNGALQYNDGNELFVEQFTGLHDKNGKEIYEGDIIQMPHAKQDGYVITNGMWKSSVVRGRDGRWHSDNGIGFSFAYGVEVIGNIHENNIEEKETND